MILDRILATKRAEIVAAQQQISLAELKEQYPDSAPTRGFAESYAKRRQRVRPLSPKLKKAPLRKELSGKTLIR